MKEKQNMTSEYDGLEERIKKYLDMSLPENWNELSVVTRRAIIQGGTPVDTERGTLQRDVVCISEIRTELLGEHLTPRRGNSMMSRRIANIMDSMPGWRRGKKTAKLKHYGAQRVYTRIGSERDARFGSDEEFGAYYLTQSKKRISQRRTERAIAALTMCQELMLFDSTTGEVIEAWQLNKDNMELYVACKVAIEALREKERGGKLCGKNGDN